MLNFFFTDPAPTVIYTLSLHDALPISSTDRPSASFISRPSDREPLITMPSSSFIPRSRDEADRKSTRLNSSHTVISYAVFCLKKKNQKALLIPCGQRSGALFVAVLL